MAGQVLDALRPAALDASPGPASDVEEQRRQVARHWEQRVERARYEAERVGRQFHACEPENRLVARTLERQWDEALRAVRQLEDEFDRFRRSQPRTLGEAERAAIRRPAEESPAVWRAPTTTPADRRQVVRLRIDRVVLVVDPGDDRVAVRVEWAGGAVREHECRRDVSGYRRQRDWPRLSARLAALYRDGRTPKESAVVLNGEGFRPPRRAGQFTPGMVRRLLDDLGLRIRIPRKPAGGVPLEPGERWLHETAGVLGLSPHTRHGWRKKGWLHARQVGGRGGPWAVWAEAAEWERLRALKACPRSWADRQKRADLRVPGPRPG